LFNNVLNERVELKAPRVHTNIQKLMNIFCSMNFLTAEKISLLNGKALIVKWGTLGERENMYPGLASPQLVPVLVFCLHMKRKKIYVSLFMFLRQLISWVGKFLRIYLFILIAK
jgi:hypothetical protein